MPATLVDASFGPSVTSDFAGLNLITAYKSSVGFAYATVETYYAGMVPFSCYG